MTRLLEDDIRPIAEGLHEYDARLQRIIGVTLRQLACEAAGVEEARILEVLDRVRIAAVPVTSGLGLIGGFSAAVASIVSHLGFEAFVTERCDEAGIEEGIERGADILMFAADEKFVAKIPGRAHVPVGDGATYRDRVPGPDHIVDNSRATALGFVAGLELMRGTLAGESVLVLGCGPVGVAAAKALMDHGANVSLCDIDRERARAALRELGGDASNRLRMEDTPNAALKRHTLIFDATNAGPFIESAHLTPQSMVAAPGMPCALTPQAMAKNRDRILHDALEIGTATMALQAAVRLASTTEAGEANEK